MNNQSRDTTITRGRILGGMALVVVVLGLSTLVGMSLREDSSASAEVPTPPGQADRAKNLAAMGGLVYQVHCTRCHGAEGRGDGLDASVLKPPPRDFGGSQWRTDRSLGSIQRVTSEGIPETAMVGFKRVLSNTEIEAVSSVVAELASQAKRLAPLVDAAGFASIKGDPLAPDLKLVDLDGKARRLEDFRGRVVLIDFWGPSCASCLSAMPGLEILGNARRAEGLEILPVCVGEDDPERVKAVLKQSLKQVVPYLDDSLGRQLFDVQTTPTIVLIGRDGRMIARAQGIKDWNSPGLRTLLDAVLAQ